MEFPEGELHIHPDLEFAGVSICSLIVDPAAAFQVNDNQGIGQVKGKDSPVIQTEGEYLTFFINNSEIIKLVFCLAPHADPLRRELDMAADLAALSVSPDQCLVFAVEYVVR